VTTDQASPPDETTAGGDRTPLVDQLVDWELAVSVAGRLSPPGPQVTQDQADRAVDQLRRLAERATGHVGETSGLHVAPDTGAVVVDRRGWARANVAAFRSLLEEPVVRARDARRAKDEREGRSRREDGPGAAAAVALARRATGAEVGALLSYLAPRVLGQYDAFGPDPAGPGAPTRSTGTPEEPGRLLLVAPNVVAVERELQLRPRDFRLWVCLHEETHRVQFTAAPWLAPHLRARTEGLVGDVVGEPGELLGRLRTAARRLPGAVGEGGDGLVGLLATPEQQAVITEVTAVMSLLEGHADVVMDEVGPSVVPSVATIRQRFATRREGRPGLDRVVRRLLGLDAKMRQYTDGAAFVRGVVADVGFEGLNAVWTGPQMLPAPAEIADPRAWVRRVHG